MRFVLEKAIASLYREADAASIEGSMTDRGHTLIRDLREM